MNTVIEQEGAVLRARDVAANDDSVASQFIATKPKHSTSESGGWDAYDVWRRLIKDARDRRSGAAFPQ
jgi:hypothetical protein